MAKAIAIAGSLSKNSWNKVILEVVVGAARSEGVEVEVVDLAELNLPFVNTDLEGKNEDGSIAFPEPVLSWRNRVAAVDGVIIASPEHNFSIPAVLKNAVDWATRPNSVISGKIAATCGTTPGPGGTLSAQEHLRTVLSSVNVQVIAGNVRVPSIFANFDKETGKITPAFNDRLVALGQSFAKELKLHKQ